MAFNLAVIIYHRKDMDKDTHFVLKEKHLSKTILKTVRIYVKIGNFVVKLS